YFFEGLLILVRTVIYYSSKRELWLNYGKVKSILDLDAGERCRNCLPAPVFTGKTALRPTSVRQLVLWRAVVQAAAPRETRCVLESGFEPDLKTTTKQVMAKSASSTKPSANAPVACRTAPRTSGGKNPPSPPAAPTSPVTAPTDCGKYSGTSLKTAP